ncbi:MAG: MFS transporter, partial [Armatimonadetes bacterium]|nr:MFS transporter [Armatimonadota bacterium]
MADARVRLQKDAIAAPESPRVSRLRGFGALTLPLLVDACTALGYVPFPRVALHFGATPFQLGLLGSLPLAAFVAVCLTAGGLSDRWGRRRVLLVGVLGHLLALALARHAASLPVLLLAAALLGVGGGFFWPAVEAAVGDTHGHGTLGRGLLLFNLGWTGGMSLGAAAGGWLSDLGLFLPFTVGLAVGGAAIPILFFWPPRGAAPGDEEHPALAPMAAEAADHFLLLARIANFTAFFAVACVRALFTPLGEHLGFGGGLIGGLIGLVTVAQALTFVPLAGSRRWQYRMLPVLAAQSAVVAAMLGTGLSASPWAFALSLAALGAGVGVTYTASLFYSLNRPTGRGRMGAIHEAILGGGAMAGPFLGGALANRFGLRAPYFLAAAVVALG